jgi:uncharacterized protein YjbI with pentapeptide repeats
VDDQAPTQPDSNTDRVGLTYWASRGMPWRREPEIGGNRKDYLAQRLAAPTSVEKGIYPFRDENGSIKLTRADVEWLLAELRDGPFSGPIDWNDRAQRHRSGVDLRGADLSGDNVDFYRMPLARMRGGLTLEDIAQPTADQLAWAAVNLRGVSLYHADLSGAFLRNASLQGATLYYAHLEGARLQSAHLEGADLRRVFFDDETGLNGVHLADAKFGGAVLADVRWRDANVSVIDWSKVSILGDERVARGQRIVEPEDAPGFTSMQKYQRASRAYSQVSNVLHLQGLSDDADRFVYRSYVLRRKALFRQGNGARWLLSLLLGALSGYGYRLGRMFAAYLLTVIGFATLYFAFGSIAGQHLSPQEAVLISFTGMHGRVFVGNFGLDSVLSWIAGVEALAGIVFEGVFVAMLVQRLFVSG